MLITCKFQKNIAGRTKRPRGPNVNSWPRVWDPWAKLCARQGRHFHVIISQ